MELLIWLWLYDNRWLWGLPYPAKTAQFWLLPLVAAVVACVAHIKNEPRVRGVIEFRHMDAFLDMYGKLQFINVALIGALLVKQYILETIKVLPDGIDIDEHYLQINHYWKRKDALFSPIGKTVAAFNGCLLFYASMLYWKYQTTPGYACDKVLVAHSLMEVITQSYIIMMGSLFCISKFSTMIGFKHFPKILIKCKRMGERKHKMLRERNS